MLKERNLYNDLHKNTIIEVLSFLSSYKRKNLVCELMSYILITSASHHRNKRTYVKIFDRFIQHSNLNGKKGFTKNNQLDLFFDIHRDLIVFLIRQITIINWTEELQKISD